MRIVLLGKPGSGKGTQAVMLSEKTGLPHLSSGAILRDEIRERTPFGLRIEEYVLRGEIGPQELITDVVFGHIERKRYASGFILDGFPRTVYQAEKLDEQYRPARCVLIDVPDDLIVDRISQRLTCAGCGAIYHTTFRPPSAPGVCDSCGAELRQRSDDNAEAIRNRPEIFRNDVQPVVDRYRDANHLIAIDGTSSPGEVYKTLEAATISR
ncbi:MAG: nucleoside monophosphate kinase [Candidatus Krumholzibacteria bacterium]|nr:nucleoside monophosphate kinase [Candidatus Krumholzibacteria bacterium]